MNSWDYETWKPFVGSISLGPINYMSVFRFLVENIQIENGLLQFRWLSIDSDKLANLKTSVPELFDYDHRYIWWAGKLFSVLKSPPVLTGGQITILDNLVKAIDPDDANGLVRVLGSYQEYCLWTIPQYFIHLIC